MDKIKENANNAVSKANCSDEELISDEWEEVEINAIDFDLGPRLNASTDVHIADKPISRSLNPLTLCLQ